MFILWIHRWPWCPSNHLSTSPGIPNSDPSKIVIGRTVHLIPIMHNNLDASKTRGIQNHIPFNPIRVFSLLLIHLKFLR